MKKMKGLLITLLFMSTSAMASGIPVFDVAQFTQWVMKNIPLQSALNGDSVKQLRALKEFAPAEYSQVMQLLEDQMADEFMELVGLVDNQELVFSYDERTNLLYTNALKEHVKTAVIAQRAYNSASATQSELDGIAGQVIEMITQADRETALINTTSETAAAVQSLIKMLAQEAKMNAQVDAERFYELDRQAKARVGDDGFTAVGCLPDDTKCLAEKSQDLLDEMDKNSYSVDDESSVTNSYLRSKE